MLELSLELIRRVVKYSTLCLYRIWTYRISPYNGIFRNFSTNLYSVTGISSYYGIHYFLDFFCGSPV
jgi:hypothetical protein